MTKTTVSKKQYADLRDFMTSLLFRKWTIAIILSLGTETKRYSVLYRFLPGVIQKVLTEHLKKLGRRHHSVLRPTQLLPVSLCLNYCKSTLRKRPIANCLLGRTPKAFTPVFRIAN